MLAIRALSPVAGSFSKSSLYHRHFNVLHLSPIVPLVLDNQRQLICVDVVNVAVDVDMLWRAYRFCHQPGVVFQRGHVVAYADTFTLVEVGDVRVMFLLIGVDNAVSSEGGRTAMGVMDNDDVLDAE